MRRLADDPDAFESLAGHAAGRLGLDRRLIVADYWLVRTLCAWTQAVGDGWVQRRYENPDLSGEENLVGRFVFGGGTSLSAAWRITERWSEDIDLVLSPTSHATPRHLAQACQRAFSATALLLPGSHTVTSRDRGHSFASFLRDRQQVSRIDVSFTPLDAAPTWTQREPVMSMIGRTVEDDLLKDFPELGGFEIETLGPGTTAMNKLLAQAQSAASGDLGFIAERARDVYDLACIARHRDRFEGHIGRDGRALLHLAERAHADESRRRPLDGFASLRTFDPATPEHEALAGGYEDVLDSMVWGEKIPLDEAILLAVSLDPGPPEPHRPTWSGPHVAYPRQ